MFLGGLDTLAEKPPIRCLGVTLFVCSCPERRKIFLNLSLRCGSVLVGQPTGDRPTPQKGDILRSSVRPQTSAPCRHAPADELLQWLYRTSGRNHEEPYTCTHNSSTNNNNNQDKVYVSVIICTDTLQEFSRSKGSSLLYQLQFTGITDAFGEARSLVSGRLGSQVTNAVWPHMAGTLHSTEMRFLWRASSVVTERDVMKSWN